MVDEYYCSENATAQAARHIHVYTVLTRANWPETAIWLVCSEHTLFSCTWYIHVHVCAFYMSLFSSLSFSPLPISPTGLSLHTFHGNFFVRSTDLLSLPNTNPDHGYTINLAIDENLKDMSTVCFQAALLYTSSRGRWPIVCVRTTGTCTCINTSSFSNQGEWNYCVHFAYMYIHLLSCILPGERRIRVHTLCLPVSSQLSVLYSKLNVQAIAGVLANMGKN